MKLWHFFWLIAICVAQTKAATTINRWDKFAFAANFGWLNWQSDVSNGAVIGEYVCSGYVYAANVGWINLGNGHPANGIRYQNNSASDFGVNHDGQGNLAGLAWGANIGWLVFTNADAKGAPFEGPKIDSKSGVLSGWIFAPSIGWITLNPRWDNLADGQTFVRTERIDPGFDGDSDGLPDAWELQYAGTLGALHGQADDDGDGITNAGEYLADTDPWDPDSALRVTSVTSVTLSNRTLISLTWTSVPTRCYRLRYRPDLDPTTPWQNLPGFGPIIPDPGPTTTRVFSHFPFHQGFFSIGVEQKLAPPERVYCGTAVWPDVATDGQKIYLNYPNPAPVELSLGWRVILIGLRYNVSPPRSFLPQGGLGSERIYCGCQFVQKEPGNDPDGASGDQFFFIVPKDAPSGAYTVKLLPPGGECPPGGIRFDNCPETECHVPTLFITPSYIVTMLNQMDIHDNSEPQGEHPAELSFEFASFSGAPEAGAPPLLQFAGRFPGGAAGSGHLTHADHTSLTPELPIFIGAERRMTAAECQEESVSFPATSETRERVLCDQYLGRFTDHFEIGFSGIEHDTSPSRWWGIAAGAGAAALICYVEAKYLGKPCDELAGGSIAGGLGYAIGSAINRLLEDDDDHLGYVSAQFVLDSSNPFCWSGGSGVQRFKMGGEQKTGGDIDLHLQNRRVGGPRIAQWSVKLKSLTIQSGYEEGTCEEPNEVFLHARAFLFEGGPELPPTQRYPAGNDFWSIQTGQTANFGRGLVLGEKPFDVNNAPESPLLYVEIGVWEDDDEKDLIGLHSRTFFLADFLGTGFGQVEEQISPEGRYIRRVKRTEQVDVHGFVGSDHHCYFIFPPAHSHLSNIQGRASLRYEVAVTWLKEMSR